VPLQNRMTPLGVPVADPARGLVYGNRGCMHDADGRIRRAFGVRRWISCRLRFKDWRRGPLLQPGRFTELFFLDEATAFAAGHRPCALCRREDYRRFTQRWASLHPDDTSADAVDDRLHAERYDATSRSQRHHTEPFAGLPDGAFVLCDGAPWLVDGSSLLAWTPAGYTRRIARPSEGEATVITPLTIVAVLREPWDGVVPFVHASARAA
jgi:hypothetical protein